MAHAVSSRRKRLYGSMSALLTVILIAAIILANTIVYKLAYRYGWFINMRSDLLYPVTDTCFDYLDTYVMPNVTKDQPIRLIFCDDESDIRESSTSMFVLNTAEELADRYADTVSIEFLNIWEHPSVARSYGVTASTSVIVACGDEHRVCTLRDFFVFPENDNENPTAYNGEKRFCVAMKAVTSSDVPVCYFVLNHGESLADYSLMYAMTDAGYMVTYLDTLSFDIPDNCAMLVCCNPLQDFAQIDSVSGYSEIDKLDRYLDNGGNMMLFVSADTFAAGSFPNLETWLSGRGIRFDHATGASGVEECFSIRDTGHSLTPDGYTILGRLTEAGSSVTEKVSGSIRLGNATGISVAEGFSENADGSYSGQNGLTVTPILASYAGAEAWAGGRTVAKTDTGFNLMTLSSRNGQGQLAVCSSVDFCDEKALGSGVYANESLILSVVEATGKKDTPIRMTSQPFADNTIHILTTKEARTVTVLLVAVPAGLALVSGLVVLVRRKYA